MRHRAMPWSTAFVLTTLLMVPRPVPGASQDVLDTFIRLSGPGPADAAGPAPVEYRGRFSGYTNFWQTSAWSWQQHGSLFLIGQPDVGRAIAQNKADIAEELGLPGLVVDEGFFKAWLERPAAEIEDPGERDLDAALAKGDVLVWAKPSSPLGIKLRAKVRGLADARAVPGSHQARAAGYRETLAFALAAGNGRLLAVLAEEAGDRRRLKELLTGLRDVVDRYTFHRGWFGTGTLLHSVTCHPGHPLEVVGQGLGQGNDWFTFSGYMDFMMREQLPAWLEKVGLRDVAVDVGTGKATHSLGSVAYGLRSYDGLKIQDMPTEEEWLRFVKDRGGYVFRPVYAPESDKYVRTTDRSPSTAIRSRSIRRTCRSSCRRASSKTSLRRQWSSSPRRGGDGAGTRCGGPSSAVGRSASCRWDE